MQAVLKPHRRYLAYRVYAVVMVLAWWAAGIAAYAWHVFHPLELLLIPLFVPALFLVFNLAAFKAGFSVFGRYQRTPPPTSPALTSASATSGSIGMFSATAPFFSWHLHAEGIAFKIAGVGAGFVPLAAIDSSKTQFSRSSYVYHTSMEVRGPLSIPSDAFRERLRQLLQLPPLPTPHKAT